MVAALRTSGVGAAIGFAFMQLMAVELIFVSYGVWLTEAFGATREQLGLFFGLLGLVELVGALGATLLTDRLGKRRAVLTGFASVGLLLLLLPLSEGNWWLFIPLFLLFDLCFEFSIVSIFPLVSGLSTNARATVLSLTIATIGVGRIAGSLAGPWILGQFGFWANGLLAGLLALSGVAIGLVLVREGSH
jgi:predicted MFS family arabinose efflux permease